MELRPLIKQKPLLQQGNNKYIVVVMGLIGLLVGGFFAVKFVISMFK